MDAPAPARVAATVLVLRDAEPGPEVLMVRRHARSGFAADAWVFPGGTVDDADRALHPARWTGIDPPDLSERFDAPDDLVLGFHVAAVRETFEEAGLLLARHGDGREPDITSPAYAEMRTRMADRQTRTDFTAWLDEEDLVLDLGRLTYFARWITPVIERRRFDTAFFLAIAPTGQVADHDRVEITDTEWVVAADALRRSDAGELLLWPPTRASLEALARFDSVAAFMSHAAGQEEIPPIQPHVEVHDDGWRFVLPDDPDYPHDRYAPGGDLAGTGPPETRT